MGRCEMVWTTAGTNRVCGRCMELKDTVVGTTDQSGVTIPPLHPRCRCAIMYREVGTPRVMQPKPNKTLPHNSETEFDLQRFGTYEDQVKSHGGSGNIKPDKVVEGHDSNPRRAEPFNIIDHKNHTGKVDKRAFYDEDGKIYLEVHATNHNLQKTHPFGIHGEHAHDLTWVDGQAKRPSKGRELTMQERKDNGDIL